MQSILLRHLEAHAHAIVVIHNAAHGTHRSAAGKIQLAQGLDQGEQLLLLKEKADAIGSAGGKTRSTQQQTLQLDGMRSTRAAIKNTFLIFYFLFIIIVTFVSKIHPAYMMQHFPFSLQSSHFFRK